MLKCVPANNTRYNNYQRLSILLWLFSIIVVQTEMDLENVLLCSFEPNVYLSTIIHEENIKLTHLVHEYVIGTVPFSNFLSQLVCGLGGVTFGCALDYTYIPSDPLKTLAI